MIVLVGLSHKTAPIAVRERAAIPSTALPELLADVVAQPEFGEILAVTTCNRVELLAGDRSGADFGEERMAHLLVQRLAARAPGIEPYLYAHSGDRAVHHLFRVAASLDSMVVGEPQILGQLKQAIAIARGAHTLGRTLNRAATHAVRTAKRVRTETGVGAGQVSVPSVALDLARQVFGELKDRAAVLLGSGEMAETVARLLVGDGARLFIVGRNRDRVRELAGAVRGTPLEWHELERALVEADVVITSTSAPGYVVSRQLVNKLRRARRGRSLFFIDLAVPRDVDPTVNELENVFLYNVDDFSRVVEETLSVRKREAERAELIVAEEVDSFMRWLDADRITPPIIALRERMRGVLHQELERSLRTRLKHLGSCERVALTRMLDAGVNKLCHAPTVRLRDVAADREFEGYRASELADALAELFGLDASPCDARAHALRPTEEPDGEESGQNSEARPVQPRSVGGASR